MIELIKTKLLETRSNSVKLYLARQEAQIKLQQDQLRATQIDQELLKLDGEERILEYLMKEFKINE